jgi:HAE1 family hydrophobic/amphiphilic exporter-1
VQNRAAVAEARLPEEVRRLGLTVRKNSPDMLMVIHLNSPDGSRDQLYLSNYATLQVRDTLARLEGVGDVRIFGSRDYAMRVWLDPDRVTARRLTAGDVLAALRAQNVQVASGVLNQPPVPTPGAYQLNVETQGRLIEPSQFANIIVRTDPDGRVTRLRDVARVELGAQDYGANGYLDEREAVPILIYQRPGSNALATADRVIKAMEELSRSFPSGMRYDIVYNPTEFIAESVHEVIKTIFEAIALVVLVVILFLQTWRASIVPILAIPVSLIGTFAVLSALGFSLNTLSLFGLVLAIGIVVDDAIVVVENVERNLRLGLSPREATRRTMDEVGGALIAIALVLTAVFIPAALVPGISGQFFRQFAVTIATATVISLLVSLTLSPALCALLFKPHQNGKSTNLFARPFRAFFKRLQRRLRAPQPRICWTGAARDQAGNSRSAGLWRAGGARGLSISPGADRLHSGPGPRLSHHHCAATAGLGAVADGCGRPQGRQDHSGHGRDHPCGAVCRSRRRHLHQRVQCRRDFLGAGTIQGAGRERLVSRPHPRRSDGAARCDPGGVRHHHRTAAGARRRYRRRLQDDGPGSP